MEQPMIAVDAGHYGLYNRSPAVPEYYESTAMWKLHKMLMEALSDRGAKTVATREDQQKDKPLTERGRMAEGCRLLMSLHSNAAERKNADYVRVYCLADDAGTDADEISRAVGEKLAPVIAYIMGVEEGWEVLPRLASTDKNGDGVLNDNYYGILNGARQVDTPAVIVEHSFHTNPKIANWLLDDNNLKRLAEAEADVLAEYFGITKPADDAAEQAAEMYRVRRSWDDPKSQLWAGTTLAYAIDACPIGYKVYNSVGTQVYPVPVAEKKTVTVQLPLLEKGSKGEAVKAMQQLLIAKGFDCGTAGADGDFGNATKAAVVAFQEKNSLDADGIVGSNTWKALLGI